MTIKRKKKQPKSSHPSKKNKLKNRIPKTEARIIVENTRE